jgi:capsid protein
VNDGHRIEHGVEFDSKNREVAYWVTQDDGDSKRLAAYGRRTGRRMAYLYRGTDNKIDAVRGTPLLAIILQSMKELDRYRDSALRKAVVNSMLALFIKKGEDKIGSLPLQGGAARVGVDSVSTRSDATSREFVFQELFPGMAMQELQQGEEPVGFQSNIEVDFGRFEEAIIAAVAWANEIPPEILRLSFSSNYSASQAAINEFKMFLNKKRALVGANLCQPVYQEWLIASAINRKISGRQLLDAWRDPRKYDIFGAYMVVDWVGAIKPSADLVKTAKGYAALLKEGLIDRDRATRETTGMKFSKVVRNLENNNRALAAALEPLLEVTEKAKGAPEAVAAAVEDIVAQHLEGLNNVDS